MQCVIALNCQRFYFYYKTNIDDSLIVEITIQWPIWQQQENIGMECADISNWDNLVNYLNLGDYVLKHYLIIWFFSGNSLPRFSDQLYVSFVSIKGINIQDSGQFS